jgi:hypothetical protein
MIRTIMYPTDMVVTTMVVATTVMVAVMVEEEGIGTTIQMGAMRIVATTVVQIVLGEAGAEAAGDASLLLL